MELRLCLVVLLATMLSLEISSSAKTDSSSKHHATVQLSSVKATTPALSQRLPSSGLYVQQKKQQDTASIHSRSVTNLADALDTKRRQDAIIEYNDGNSVDACEVCLCHENQSGDLVADCTGRNLTEIPTSLPDTISQLLLADNCLTALPNASFQKFTRLRVLDLSRNILAVLASRAFKGLGNVQVLYLHGNKLRYTPDIFTAEVLAPLRSLRHLTLHNNTDDMAEDLDYPHLALSRLPLLEELSLNGLTNKTFGRGFAHLTSLRNLSMSGDEGFCKMETVLNTTFEHLPFLSLLNLSNCNLFFIDSGAFQGMREIDTLDLSSNVLLGFDNVQRATYGLQNSTIRALFIKDIYPPFATCVHLTRKHMQYFAHTALEEIHVEGNQIQFIERHALLAIRSVKRLYAGENTLLWGPYYMDAFRLDDLEVLNLDMKQKHLPNIFLSLKNFDFPSAGSCDNDVNKITPTLYQDVPDFFHDANNLQVFVLPLMPNLTVYSTKKSGMHYEITHIKIVGNRILEHVDVSENQLRSWEGPIEGVDNLRLLNMSNNFGSMRTDSPMFTSFPALEVLDLSANLLRPALAGDSNGTIFGHLKALRVLNISANGLDLLPRKLFQGLRSLEHLNLRDNRITSEGFAVDLRRMSNLSHLDLSSNNLDRLTPNATSMLDKLASGMSHPFYLDLRDNPLSCTCGNSPFLTWLNVTHVQVVGRSHVQCVHEDGTTGPVWEGWETLQQRCGESVALFMGSAVGALLILVILVGLVLYRYRWKIRYIYYVARSHYRRENPPDEAFKYDVFLSYSTDDYKWVTRQLLPHLEAQGLRACLHQRDFLPGRPIAANIVEAVQTSRRTVCVLSPNFLDSQWCLYEMQMAILEGVHSRRDALLLLLYHHVCAHSLPRETLCLMQSDTYLEYPRDPECLEAFWENLGLAIRQ